MKAKRDENLEREKRQLLATGFAAGLLAGIREAATLTGWLDGDAKLRAKAQILRQWESLSKLIDLPTFEQHVSAFLMDRCALHASLQPSPPNRASSVPVRMAPVPLSRDLLCGSCGTKFIGSDLHVGSPCTVCPGRLGLLRPLTPEDLDNMKPLKRVEADIRIIESLKQPDRQPLWSDDPDCLKCGKKNAYHYTQHGYFQCSCGHNWLDSRAAYDLAQARGRGIFDSRKFARNILLRRFGGEVLTTESYVQAYSGKVADKNLIPGTIVVTCANVKLQDDGRGNWQGRPSANGPYIDYARGHILVSLPWSVPSGNQILVSYDFVSQA